jgi:hypothetical protein
MMDVSWGSLSWKLWNGGCNVKLRLRVSNFSLRAMKSLAQQIFGANSNNAEFNDAWRGELWEMLRV